MRDPLGLCVVYCCSGALAYSLHATFAHRVTPLFTAPVKTGTHTYASWRNKEDSNEGINRRRENDGDEDFLDDEDSDDDNEYPERGASATRGRRGGAGGINMENANPFMEWARKLYDSIFFYGLDAQIPQGQNRGRWTREDRRMQRDRKAMTKKSMFLTPIESLGEEYVSSFAGGKKIAPREGTGKRSDVSSGEAATLQRRIHVLDECIKGMKIDLEIIDKALDGGAVPGEMQDLLRQKSNILDAIETMQVQYVALCVENEET